MTKHDKKLAFVCIFIAYMLPLTQTIISLGLGRKDIIFNYSSLIYGSVSILSIFYYLAIKIKSNQISKTELLSIGFILYMMLNVGCTALANNGMSKVAYDSFLEMGVKVIPAVLIALVASRRHCLNAMVSILDYFIVIATVCIVKVSAVSIFTGVSRARLFDIYGVDYQYISYFSAYFCALDLFMIFEGKKNLTSRVRSSLFFQWIRLVCAVFLGITSLYSGGRGGFVLIMLMVLFWVLLYSIYSGKVKQFIGSVCLIIVLIGIVSSIAQENEVFRNGIARTFEFLGDGGINWDGVSGRGDIYKRAIQLICASPIWGYGITGGSYHGVISAHNLFLEILVEGGLIYLIVWVYLLAAFLCKLYKKCKINKEYLLIFTIFMCDFVGVMFSFIYLRRTAIWFAMFYIFNEKKDNGYEEKNRDAKLP